MSRPCALWEEPKYELVSRHYIENERQYIQQYVFELCFSGHQTMDMMRKLRAQLDQTPGT
jgi:hypothetical protein